MNAASLVILLVSAECGEVLEGVGVAAPLDIAGAQVMVEGVTVLVHVPLLDDAVCHPEVAASAGRLIADERRCHMPMEMALGKGAGAGAEVGQIISNFESMQKFSNYVFTVLGLSYGYVVRCHPQLRLVDLVVSLLLQ